jgi:hypothetical protein
VGNPTPNIFHGKSYVGFLDQLGDWFGTLLNPIYTRIIGTITISGSVVSLGITDDSIPQYQPIPLSDEGSYLKVGSPVLSHAGSNGTPIGSATDTAVVAAPAANHHLSIHRLHAANGGATATWVYWRDGVAGTKLFAAYLPQGGIFSIRLEGDWALTGAGTPTALYLTTSAAGSVEWSVTYKTVTE